MKGLHRLTASAMALFLAASFISYSWSAPQGPLVMVHTGMVFYFHPVPIDLLEGRRFISDESQRKDLYDRLQLGLDLRKCVGFVPPETRSQNTNPISLSEAAELFLNSLRKAQEAEEETNDHPGYLTDNLLNW